jgi:DNA-binding CsgD family transcriptional regulator
MAARLEVGLKLVALTPREFQVAKLIARGLSQPEIAVELKISRRTVEVYAASLRRKTGAPTSRKAAARAR